MNTHNLLVSFLAVLNAMSPYLLLGFLIAGVLHVFVPKRFYAKYLSRDNKLSVLWAALLGIPLPLCSCGVIPTAVGLKNEGASKGAVGIKFFDKFKKQDPKPGRWFTPLRVCTATTARPPSSSRWAS